MATSAPGCWVSADPRAPRPGMPIRPIPLGAAVRRVAGFTLIELAVVMLILVIILGVVGVNLTRGTTDIVRDEGQRLALLLQAAQEDAILEGRYYAFTLAPEGYRFLRVDAEGALIPVADDPLRPRTLPRAVTLDLEQHTLDASQTSGKPGTKTPPIIVFDPTGTFPGFTLVLRAGDSAWFVQGTANGKILSAPTRAADEA